MKEITISVKFFAKDIKLQPVISVASHIAGLKKDIKHLIQHSPLTNECKVQNIQIRSTANDIVPPELRRK